jgi:chloride channel protein, CIC family
MNEDAERTAKFRRRSPAACWRWRVGGLLGVMFRLALAQADRLRDAAIALAHGQQNGLLLVILACAAATRRLLVREFSPPASDSGIPHVEAVQI